MPRDMKRFEKTGVESRALKAARSKLMQAVELWESYDNEREQTERLASAKNIDQHMIDALDAKIAHIDEVLGEDSGAMIADDGGKDSGVTRLAQATQKRVQSRCGGTKQANEA